MAVKLCDSVGESQPDGSRKPNHAFTLWPAKTLGLNDPALPGGDVAGLTKEAAPFEFLVP